jgi:hypothetical protein
VHIPDESCQPFDSRRVFDEQSKPHALHAAFDEVAASGEHGGIIDRPSSIGHRPSSIVTSKKKKGAEVTLPSALSTDSNYRLELSTID